MAIHVHVIMWQNLDASMKIWLPKFKDTNSPPLF